MVAVVSNEVEINSLADLKGKHLCHPGYDEKGWLTDWSEVFAQVLFFYVVNVYSYVTLDYVFLSFRRYHRTLTVNKLYCIRKNYP